ncbi:hypothetical protein ACF0H5_000282 [Mactra antiquata]
MAWSTTVVVGIWMTCIALLFMAVGFSIPFWYVQSIESSNDKTFMAYTSVWYFMACEKGVADSCKSDAIAPNFTAQSAPELQGDAIDTIVSVAVTIFGHFAYWWAVQIATTVGVGLVLLAALILICCRCAGIHSKGFFVVSAILLFFGGAIGLGISILHSIGLGLFFSFVPTGMSFSAETFPWSVLLYGIGSILALISFVVVMVITCKWKKLGSYYESDKESIRENGAPMSNLSKSYDRPRKPSDRRDNDYNRRDRNYGQREFSSSKKYRDTGRDYNSRDYDRNDRNYDYQGYNRGYDKSYDDRNYSQSSRGNDYMYRPYEQYRY